MILLVRGQNLQIYRGHSKIYHFTDLPNLPRPEERRKFTNLPIYQIYHCPESVLSLASCLMPYSDSLGHCILRLEARTMDSQLRIFCHSSLNVSVVLTKENRSGPSVTKSGNGTLYQRDCTLTRCCTIAALDLDVQNSV